MRVGLILPSCPPTSPLLIGHLPPCFHVSPGYMDDVEYQSSILNHLIESKDDAQDFPGHGVPLMVCQLKGGVIREQEKPFVLGFAQLPLETQSLS